MELTKIVKISEFEEEIVIHFEGSRKKINAYSLASTLVSIADAVKEANVIINPGYEVEVIVEAFGQGSFRAVVKSAYKGLGNLFNVTDVKAVALAVLSSFVYQHTFAPDQEVKITIDDTQVIIKADDNKVIDMPILYTHNITNIGKDSLVCVFWVNEIFNPKEFGKHSRTFNQLSNYPARVNS